MQNKPFIANQDLHNFYTSKGGLFGVPVDHPLSKNIGRRIRFKNPNCGVQKMYEFTIVHLQYLYDGSVGYRLTWDDDDYNTGYPARPEQVYLV